MEKTQELILAQESLPAQQAQAPMMAFVDKICQMPDLPVEKMEKMLDMFERQQQKLAEQAFNASFAAAMAEMPMIPKSGKNNHTKKPYSKLEDLVAACRPVLSRHGLSLNWQTGRNDTNIIVTAVVRHANGHKIETTQYAPPDKGSMNDLQKGGSTETYLKRYTGFAILGLASGDEVDDDGQAFAPKAPPAPLETLTREEAKEINNLVEKSGTDETAMLAHYCVEAVELLPRKVFLPLKKVLTERVAKKQGAAT
jgi:hypothetical protein